MQEPHVKRGCALLVGTAPCYSKLLFSAEVGAQQAVRGPAAEDAMHQLTRACVLQQRQQRHLEPHSVTSARVRR